jgi:hypothetical protein
MERFGKHMSALFGIHVTTTGKSPDVRVGCKD